MKRRLFRVDLPLVGNSHLGQSDVKDLFIIYIIIDSWE